MCSSTVFLLHQRKMVVTTYCHRTDMHMIMRMIDKSNIVEYHTLYNNEVLMIMRMIDE